MGARAKKRGTGLRGAPTTAAMTPAVASPITKKPPSYGNDEVVLVLTHKTIETAAPIRPARPQRVRPVLLAGRHNSPSSRRPSACERLVKSTSPTASAH